MKDSLTRHIGSIHSLSHGLTIIRSQIKLFLSKRLSQGDLQRRALVRERRRQMSEYRRCIVNTVKTIFPIIISIVVKCIVKCSKNSKLLNNSSKSDQRDKNQSNKQSMSMNPSSYKLPIKEISSIHVSFKSHPAFHYLRKPKQKISALINFKGC